VKVAVISDIHANLFALRALEDVLDGADRIVCTGDLVGYYCQVNEVIAEIRDRNALCIAGNHDRYLVRGAGIPAMSEAVAFGISFADASIVDDHRRWLSTLPLTWGGDIGGKDWLLVHGSPWRPLEDYMYEDSPLLARLSEFAYDIVAFGQTHRPLVRRAGAPVVLNPGSVGQSRHVPGVACAAIVDTVSGDIERVERHYEVEAVIALARSHGAGEWISRHFIDPKRDGAPS
jgi:putative phosphoesterase